MRKQGQPPASPAAPVSEAEWEALENFRRDLSHARADLDALKYEVHATMAEVTEVLRPVDPLTGSVRGLSLAVERLESQLQTFAHRGTPMYLGPRPAPLGDRLIVALFFLLGLCGVGWMLFGAALERPGQAIMRLPDAPPPRPRDRPVLPPPVAEPPPAPYQPGK